MLTVLAPITSAAKRTVMSLTALAGVVSDAIRTVPALPPLLPTGPITVAVSDGSNAYTAPFAGVDLSAYTLPDKLYVCLFKPGSDIPTDPTEILAKSHSFASVDLSAGVPESVVVSVSTLPLFEGRVAKLEGVVAIPVISHPDAA